MKNVIRCIFLTLLVIVLFSGFSRVLADPPDPPPPPGTHTIGGNVTAPIDGGLSILLALGLGYGTRKFYQGRKKSKEEDLGME